jgi:hypothetical protein
MFSLDDFQKLKSHLAAGATGLGFNLNPGVSISINYVTYLGPPFWEMRIHEKPTQRMCILTEKDGRLTPDYRHLVPQPNGDYDFRPLADPEFEERARSLFVETVAFLERKREEEREANRRATDKLHAFAGDEAAMQRWQQLVGALVPDPASAEKIAKATSRAFVAPETFLKRLRLPRVTEDLPWLALIHSLRKDKRLVEFDWREDADDLAAGVDRLCARCGRPTIDWAALALGDTQSAAERLNAASRALAVSGLMLVSLDSGGDSFPTALMAVADFEAAASHAASFGWRLESPPKL